MVTVRRVVPGEPARTENLCEVHAAEARGGRSAMGGSPFGGSLFDEFFGRFFDEEPAATGAGLGARGASRGGRTEQVDITQSFSDATTELLQRAARRPWSGVAST